VIASRQNVANMKNTKKELEESQRLLQAILDNLVDGILTFDEQGEIQSVNRAGGYIFGYDAEQIVGQNIRALVPSLAKQDANEDFKALLEPLKGLGDELEGQRKDGSLFPIYFTINEVKLDHHRLYTATIQDFTERKFMEKQVWDTERLNIELEKERELRDLKNRFISMMSHDLKTPLAAIRLANSMLRNYGDRSSPEEKQESYDTIDQQVEHLTEMINDVMTISRQDFTGAELDRQIIDLETYCRDIIEELQLAYRMKRTLTFSGTDRRIEALIDVSLMRRALTNLLTNAIKYSPEGAPVHMVLTYADCTAIIKVIDHGIGIPAPDLPRMFEPFNRASNVGSIQGTGLGLAIAKQAVELHGGTINVESVVGKGTTFMITLPAEDC
jgi:PAS domain S-box-containing protein